MVVHAHALAVVNHTTFEQTDMGAYYHGSGSGGYTYAWTQPGNVISNNTFMNIKFGERRPPEDEYMSTNAVYVRHDGNNPGQRQQGRVLV